MIDAQTIAGFSDELEKIGFPLGEEAREIGHIAKGVGGKLKQFVSTGWNHPAGFLEHHGVDSAGQKIWAPRPKAQWTGRGNITSKLPIGDKAINAAYVASQVPGAVKKEDPLGESRSRAERITGLVGGTAGMLAGQGAMSHVPMRGLGLTRAIAGGMAGQMVGEHMATTPFRMARRKAEMPAQNPEELPSAGGQV